MKTITELRATGALRAYRCARGWYIDGPECGHEPATSTGLYPTEREAWQDQLDSESIARRNDATGK